MFKVYKLVLLVPLLMASITSLAQIDLLNRPDTLRYFLEKERFEIDPHADAVILESIGEAFLLNGILTRTEKRAVKVLSQSAGADVGTIVIPASHRSDVSKVKGITFNLQNGEIVREELGKADILTDKVTNRITAVKFNLPSIKAGSVVYIEYTLNYSSGDILFPEWRFQHEFPTLYSSYNASIPDFMITTSHVRTGVPFKEVNQLHKIYKEEAGYFRQTVPALNLMNMVWVRKNIPAVKEEPFSLSSNHYVEKVEFQVTSLASNGRSFSIFEDWAKFNEKSIEGNADLAKINQPNHFFNELIHTKTAHLDAPIDKAKVLFAFVRDSFAVDHNVKWLDLQEALSKRKGTPAQLGIFTAALLTKAGFPSHIMMIAKKPDEPLNALFPMPFKSNYQLVVCQVDSMFYFLDPLARYAAFGQLPSECYNGFGNIISKENYQIELVPEMNLNQEVILSHVKIEEGETPKIRLHLEKRFGLAESYELRSQWEGDLEAAKADLAELFEHPDFFVTDYSLQNLLDCDLPLILVVDAESPMGQVDRVNIQPFLQPVFNKNPFPAGERTYPVHFEQMSRQKCYFTLEYPSSFRLLDHPQNHQMIFNEGVMGFENMVHSDTAAGKIKMTTQFQIGASSVDPASYDDLRQFVDAVIRNQSKFITLTKEES